MPSDMWLLLLYQLPARPAYLRVKVWRRLQALGAVAVRNSAYALPANDQTREDLQWLLCEIVDGGGEGAVCEARFVEGLSDSELRALFAAARDADYAEIAGEADSALQELDAEPGLGRERRREVQSRLARLRRRHADVTSIDYFGAAGREACAQKLEALAHRLAAGPSSRSAAIEAGHLRNRVWVTRRGVQVDRIASAWLIRRFIDPQACFKFVPDRGYVPEPREIRFDMFEAEFTHEGDACTFEVLLVRAALNDPGLHAVGEIVHDIDLKDGKFGRDEAPGIAALIAGIAAQTRDDDERLRRGALLLDDLYAALRRPIRTNGREP